MEDPDRAGGPDVVTLQDRSAPYADFACGALFSLLVPVEFQHLWIWVSKSLRTKPIKTQQRRKTARRRDVQGAVHWVHITPEEEKPILPERNKQLVWLFCCRQRRR